MRRPSTTLATALAALLLAAAGTRADAAGPPRLVASFEDPAGDATGTGTYLPPGDTEFRDGDFDLRRFEVLVDGDDVVFEVTMGVPIRAPQTTTRTNLTPIDLWNGVYLQNVDVYVDTDGTPGSGHSACIPGRRVAFADGRTWEAAVVITPQPDAARSATAGALGKASEHILFPTGIVSRGRTLIARVPSAFLGGLPRKDWGYSVHVSGAAWERSFEGMERLFGGPEPDALTMPVRGVAEAWAFGGAPAGNAYPRVVDVLLPPGVDQARVLGSFDSESGAFAQVPFVELEPRGAPAAAAGAVAPPRAAPPPPPPALRVVDVAQDLVSISGPVAGLKPMQIGRVIGPDGGTAARLVIIQVLERGVVASAIEGRERIAPGARVEFEAPPPAPSGAPAPSGTPGPPGARPAPGSPSP